jgi:uncharacterized protein (TIGR03382 family)
MRQWVQTLAIGIAISYAPPAFGNCEQTETLSNSDEDVLFCIDANDDGEIDTDKDCCVTGTIAACSEEPQNACYRAAQATNSGNVDILGCGFETFYFGPSTPTSIEITESGLAQAVGAVILLNGQVNGNAHANGGAELNGPGGGNGNGNGNGNEPAVVKEMELLSRGSEVGSARACSIGAGPAIEIVDHGGGVAAVRMEEKYSNGVDYLCAKAPVYLQAGGTKLLDVCVPVDAEGNSVFECADDPVTVIPFASLLPSCGSAQMAPTVGQKGLVGLAVLLLVGGAWLLRRRSFSESLSLD